MLTHWETRHIHASAKASKALDTAVNGSLTQLPIYGLNSSIGAFVTNSCYSVDLTVGNQTSSNQMSSLSMANVLSQVSGITLGIGVDSSLAILGPAFAAYPNGYPLNVSDQTCDFTQNTTCLEKLSVPNTNVVTADNIQIGYNSLWPSSVYPN